MVARASFQPDPRTEVLKSLERDIERINSIEPRVQASMHGDWVHISVDGEERPRRSIRWWLTTEIPGIIYDQPGAWTDVEGQVAIVRVSILVVR